MPIRYYEINEDMARLAKHMNSHYDYEEGSATKKYRAEVDDAHALADTMKAKTDLSFHGKIDELTDNYSRRLAQWYNKHYSIETRVPSVLISGPGNFPTAKKEKQNAARKKHIAERTKVNHILKKIENVSELSEKAERKEKIEELTEKLDALKLQRADMEQSNEYYLQTGTMKGYGDMSDEQAKTFDEAISNIESGEKSPYPPFRFEINSKDIERINKQIEQLGGKSNFSHEGWTFDGGKVEMNIVENRIQVLFDDKPSEALRAELKKQGFRWAPSQKAWQRQLTENGVYAAKQIKDLQPDKSEKSETVMSETTAKTVPLATSVVITTTATAATTTVVTDTDKEDYRVKAKEKFDKTLTELEKGVKEIFESGNYREYLKTMGKFHNYSANNTILIYMQMPSASLVAGYETWKKTFGRQVNKGQTGIKIFAPCPYKHAVEREDGTVDIIEGRSYKVTTVFDVSQTSGKELPTFGVEQLKGTPENYKELFTAFKAASVVPISFAEIEGDAKGYYSPQTNSITIQKGMDGTQTIKTMIHEIAHATMHSNRENMPDQQTREVQAESVAYTVCSHYGIDTSEYSFGYVAAWSDGKELKELKVSLDVIKKAASEIITAADAKMDLLQKEKMSVRDVNIDIEADYAMEA
jgi:Zn-dependent peptidase ImmA (M78 family)